MTPEEEMFEKMVRWLNKQAHRPDATDEDRVMIITIKASLYSFVNFKANANRVYDEMKRAGWLFD